MNRQQLFLTIGSIVLIVLIFQLPRVVVENEEQAGLGGNHSIGINPLDRQAINSLTVALATIGDIEKKANFAASLAGLYLKYQMTDSAAKVADWILSVDSAYSLRSAAIYYRAFMIGGSGAAEAARKAAGLFERLSAESPEDLSLKNKWAMTLTATESPMNGIMMLRGILESDPENREAIFNLGLLAMQSGQYDKAEERFRALITLSDTDHEAYFYLAIVLKELGKTEESRQVMSTFIEFENADAALKATAESFLKELNNS